MKTIAEKLLVNSYSTTTLKIYSKVSQNVVSALALKYEYLKSCLQNRWHNKWTGLLDYFHYGLKTEKIGEKVATKKWSIHGDAKLVTESGPLAVVFRVSVKLPYLKS